MKKKKKASKTKDIELGYQGRVISGVKAKEFAFNGKSSPGVSIMAIDLPRIGVFVTGKGGDAGTRLCWAYPPGTAMKKAVGLSIAKILEDAAAQFELAKKVSQKA